VIPKYGLTAVRRNRLKRRVREMVRLHLLPIPIANDVLIRARRAAYDAPLSALRADLTGLVPQLQEIRAR
jgi:ribonuclease P protein component